ncbi:MAG: hypothetical protein U5K84_12205 [Alkalibacterium sp.]|nr:hypothetical protein [Alkalibacterium sp.]
MRLREVRPARCRKTLSRLSSSSHCASSKFFLQRKIILAPDESEQKLDVNTYFTNEWFEEYLPETTFGEVQYPAET